LERLQIEALTQQPIEQRRVRWQHLEGGVMKSASVIPPAEKHSEVAAGIAARFVQLAVGFGMIAAALFLSAGRIDWAWAWVFLGISLASVVINGTIMLRTSPETIAERGRPGAMQGWDKLVSGLWAAAQYLALPLVAGLDVRFGWSPLLDDGWHWLGAGMFAAGLALISWAMLVNTYFSTVVRVQRERGQTVCRTGPYRYVRHPGYAGILLRSLGIPVLLGSWWALIPGIAAIALMVIRTVLEDRLLRAELAGYQAYAQDVRFRLVPGIW
jgi:protein-S-isoprenylcysteine O-methyltransferase Ste14